MESMHPPAEATASRAEPSCVPRLAADWEERGRDLSPAEGFLLSRIDGRTAWVTLRQIGGMVPEEADRCLECWVARGLVLLEYPAQEGALEPVAADPKPEAGALDPGLDIPLDLQRRIVDFEASLDRPYHELLGVGHDADSRTIKRAYFALSKDFHPDRYFRREVGSFGPRLDRIFKRIALAYELLMDPTTRAQIEAASPPPPPAVQPVAVLDGKVSGRQLALERLRRRFRIPDEVVAERRFKGRQFHDAARQALARRDVREAASAIRLAIAFDPWADEYKELFASIQADVNQIRAAELLEEARGAFDSSSAQEALRLLEEALAYQPSNAEIHDGAARAALELEDGARAHELAERACELAPDVGAYRVTLSRSLRRQGLMRRAREALEVALRLDPDDEQAREDLERLRRRTRPGSSSGGMR
jgi:curved DNA-binding protein CbpA